MNIWQHSKADGCSDGQCLFMALYATIKWWAAEFWRGRTNLKKIKLKLSSKKTVELLKMFVKSVSQHASNSCRFRHQHLLRKKQYCMNTCSVVMDPSSTWPANEGALMPCIWTHAVKLGFVCPTHSNSLLGVTWIHHRDWCHAVDRSMPLLHTQQFLFTCQLVK